MKLIDKGALVAEIERRRRYHLDLTEYNSGYKNALIDILSFLDTLEVKEVDLEKELKHLIGNVGQCDRKLAKYFFELGLKTKGE